MSNEHNMEFPSAVTHVPLVTAAPVKQRGLGPTSTVLYCTCLGRRDCVLFTSLAQILSACIGDLNHLHVGHKTISLTFWLQNTFSKAGAFCSKSKKNAVKITSMVISLKNNFVQTCL